MVCFLDLYRFRHNQKITHVGQLSLIRLLGESHPDLGKTTDDVSNNIKQIPSLRLKGSQRHKS